jgi:hypothetical protein
MVFASESNGSLNFTEIGAVPLFIWGWRFLGVLDDAGVFQRLA